jgi:hypothetical protein
MGPKVGQGNEGGSPVFKICSISTCDMDCRNKHQQQRLEEARQSQTTRNVPDANRVVQEAQARIEDQQHVFSSSFIGAIYFYEE